jgi:hypothetical protein
MEPPVVEARSGGVTGGFAAAFPSGRPPKYGAFMPQGSGCLNHACRIFADILKGNGMAETQRPPPPSLDLKLEELRVRLRRSSLFRCAAQHQRDSNLRPRLQTSVKIEVETDGEYPAASQVCRRALDGHATLEQAPLPRLSCKEELADLPRTKRRRCKRSRGGKRHRRRVLSMEIDKCKGKGKGQSSVKRIPRWTSPMKTRAASAPLPPPRPMPKPKRRPRGSMATGSAVIAAQSGSAVVAARSPKSLPKTVAELSDPFTFGAFDADTNPSSAETRPPRRDIRSGAQRRKLKRCAEAQTR